jgi:hypothetical protein
VRFVEAIHQENEFDLILGFSRAFGTEVREKH